MTSWSQSELLMTFILVYSRIPIPMNLLTCMNLSSEDGEIPNLSLEKENKVLTKLHTLPQEFVIMIPPKDTESPITMEKSPFIDFTKNTKKLSCIGSILHHLLSIMLLELLVGVLMVTGTMVVHLNMNQMSVISQLTLVIVTITSS